MEFDQIYDEILKFEEPLPPMSESEVTKLAEKTALAIYIKEEDNTNADELLTKIKKETTPEE